MKSLKTILTLGFSLAMFSSFGTIINVNNDTPSPGEYDNLQDAVDAASAGDTLYLAPTLVNYGNVTISKQLAIIGPGYVVSSGILGAHAVVEDISLTDIAASGSVFSSFRFNELVAGFSGAGTITDLQIMRCLIDTRIYMSNDYMQSSIIEGNVFLSASYNLHSAAAATFKSSTISNNIFNGWLYNIDNCEISNNIFLGLTGGTNSILYSTTNSSVVDNIAIGRSCNAAGASNVYAGNISFDGSNNNFPNGTNLTGIDPQFVNAPVGLFDFTFDYSLDVGSPAIGAGTGGADIGIYSGNGVYRKDGEPSIPIIRQVNVPGGTTVPANATFTINIISEAHE